VTIGRRPKPELGVCRLDTRVKQQHPVKLYYMAISWSRARSKQRGEIKNRDSQPCTKADRASKQNRKESTKLLVRGTYYLVEKVPNYTIHSRAW